MKSPMHEANSLPQEVHSSATPSPGLGHWFALCCALFTPMAGVAEQAAPSMEFWRYFADYSNPQGDLFDPVDWQSAAKLLDNKKIQQQIKSMNTPDHSNAPISEREEQQP